MTERVTGCGGWCEWLVMVADSGGGVGIRDVVGIVRWWLWESSCWVRHVLGAVFEILMVVKIVVALVVFVF